jgi:CHAT domain-containing protein/tetratricopeptide (TPR) repeat protein
MIHCALRLRHSTMFGALVVSWLLAGSGVAWGEPGDDYDRYLQAGKYSEAEKLARTMYGEAVAGGKDEEIEVWAYNLANILVIRGRHREAQPLAERALVISRQVNGIDHLVTAQILQLVATTLMEQNQFAKAEPLLRQTLKTREQKLGEQAQDTLTTMGLLASTTEAQGRFIEAERLFTTTLARAGRLKAANPGDGWVAGLVENDLGVLYARQGRVADAERAHRRGLADCEVALGADSPVLLDNLNNLAICLKRQGKYAEAEAVYLRGLGVGKKAFGPAHPKVVAIIDNLALLYQLQERYDDAEPMGRLALESAEATVGPNSIPAATALTTLGKIAAARGELADAESYFARALAITEKVRGKNHPDTYLSALILAETKIKKGNDGDAFPLYKGALEGFSRTLGEDDARFPIFLTELARLLMERGNDAEARVIIDWAVSVTDRNAAAPDQRYEAHFLRAMSHWREGEREPALADLREAIKFAETQRGWLSGDARQRSESFGRFRDGFERMVEWQTELNDPGEALAAMEQFHARTLLDEIRQAGSDLQIGQSADDRQRTAKLDGELSATIAEREFRLQQALKGRNPDQALMKNLRDELAAARDAQTRRSEEEKAASPVFRQLLSGESGTATLAQVRKSLIGPDGLLLAYMFGEENGYVLAVSANDARVSKIELGAAEATTLAVSAGPLTSGRLKSAFFNRLGIGVLQRLANPKLDPLLTSKLAALWTTLVPETYRKSLTDGTVKRLIVIPDGPLAMLPFETLVLRTGSDPKYLLDVAPPITYGPSATILLNLSRRADSAAVASEPLVAVGDPAYPQINELAAPPITRGGLAPRSRFSMAGGALARLPYSGVEAREVVKAFATAGMKGRLLTGDAATEAELRASASGRSIVHLACHGLSDQSFGDLFATLALAPGPRAETDDADDGFLTLKEIYELKLSGCKLAILSACRSNLGPQQEGEGTWAVSRGFLVAGAKRVIASDWLVDDEAGASLVATFSKLVAEAEKAGKPDDFAESLRAAKRLIRSQANWKAPYFWASLVLIGPP